MILLGHKLVPYEPMYKIHHIEDIKKTKPNSVVLFDFQDEKLLEYCVEHKVPFALHVINLRDAIIANALSAKYILVYNQEIAALVQNIAEEYLFDAKILLHVSDESSIEIAANDGIDGIIMKCAIINI